MNKFNRFRTYWPLAWLDLIDALCWIITLGQWKPNLGIKWVINESKEELKKRLKETYNERIN